MVVAVVLAAIAAAPAAAEGSERPPNIVVVNTDDQPVSTFRPEFMPRTYERIVEPGTGFSDAIVVVPVCCPSRATLVTGQYPHNHGVLANVPGYSELREKGNVLPVWLQRAGYRTAHIGKWKHGYAAFAGPEPAPGWDRWFTLLEPHAYNDYEVGIDGEAVRFGNAPADNVTAVLNREAIRLVERHAGGDRPLYVQLDHFAPHPGKGVPGRNRCDGGPEPLLRDRGALGRIGAPRPPSFNEPDVSDKPFWAQERSLGEGRIRRLDRRYRCTAESLLGVDRGIEGLFRALERAGELERTAFMFLSDNGFFFGEHRLMRGKQRALEPSIRVPMALLLPEAIRDEQEAVVAAAVGSHDVVPTVLELAGAEPCRPSGECRVLDGRSLLDLVHGDRTGFEDRALLIEFDESGGEGPSNKSCAYQAVRTTGQLYVEHTSIPDPETGVCRDRIAAERYDLSRDPHQLQNLAPAGTFAAAIEQLALRRRLDGLRACQGIEGRDPDSPGGHCE